MIATVRTALRIRLRGLVLAGLAAGCGWGGLTATASAQLPRGFSKSVPAVVINEEIVRQPDYWMMEVQFKQMRLVWIDVVSEETGETRREQIWYLPWRAIRRPVAGRSTGDVEPVNALDPPPGPEPFLPEFTLVTYDNPQTEIPGQILLDDIIPDAMQQIRRIEREDYKDSVSVVQNLPEAVPADAEQQPWIYGAATWRGVDPDTDFFKVILGGFSNGYEIKTDDADGRQIWRKIIVQRFTRPGDRFDPTQRDFYFSGEPEWTFQPDDVNRERRLSARP